MCGIVGHLGTKGSLNKVLEGLRRLEYRGYDSAGVSFLSTENKFLHVKKTGKLANLVQALKADNFDAVSCIGHTRWATHGKVTELNAHPHHHENIAMVHNGIIENNHDLKAQLAKSGYKFSSETDTEVMLALIVTAQKNGLNFFDAVTDSFKKIHGNSAFVIYNNTTNEIIALKKGAPLVCGMHSVTKDLMVSSDPYALIGMVDQIYFPEDEVVCHLSLKPTAKISFYELDHSASNRFTTKEQGMNLDITEKGEFEHFMLKEIHEQPHLIRSLIQFYSGPGIDLFSAIKKINPKHFYITACGTACYAGFLVRDYLESINRIPATIELASEFRYRNPIFNEGTVGLFISQSGETADTLAAQSLCKKSNVKTLSIVNVDGSTLFRESDFNLLIRAGIEIGVASTKAFTQQALTGRLLSAALTGKGIDESLKKKFQLLADRIDELLKRSSEIKYIADNIYHRKGFFYTGRGVYYPVALEGALKLKEIAYVHAEGYAAGELKHGPIALIDDEMVNIAIVGPELYEKTISNIEEIKARRGVIVTLAPANDKNVEALSDFYLPLNYSGLEELSPLYANVANQLLAYYVAKNKGTDIDKPRNLAKSVTVE